MDEAVENAFPTLTQTIEGGFAAVAEDLSNMRRSMTTKDDLEGLRIELKGDIARLGEQVASIERDLKQIKRDLYEIADKLENIGGYRKEIDHALERIAAIERHLGIKRKAAA
jgi:chromosome segregation ATPase